MALFTSTPVSIIPKDQKSAGNANMQAADLSSNSRNIADSKTTSRLLTQTGSAITTLQQQIDIIMRFLRADLPQPPVLSATDPQGNLIVWIGYNVVNNTVYEGIWTENLYAGGTSAVDAPVRVVGGSIFITGPISLSGTNGVIDLDPSVPIISLVDTAFDTGISLTGSGVLIYDQTSSVPKILVDKEKIQITNSAVVHVILLSNTGGDGVIEVKDSTGSAQLVQLDGATGNISASGSINADVAFSVNSVTGYTGTVASAAARNIVGGIIV